jgi:NADH dehydrogenase [ubiquinone] 1 alpha subcomplex assembly factor 5
MIPQPAQRGGSAKSSAVRAQVRTTEAKVTICVLLLARLHRTSGTVAELFDMRLRALRRDRAARIGVELFLFERVFDDCLERIALMSRPFDRALLIGCPDPRWPERLRRIANAVDVQDPGSLFAHQVGGAPIIEDAWEPTGPPYDLVVAIGSLDTVNELPLALRILRYAIGAEGLFIGAISGGDTLPRLRAAMRAADAVSGVAVPHVHPRIEASALSPLLENAGFIGPVVDVERVHVSYPSLERLVADLRAMAATNVLTARSPPFTRKQRDAAAAAFADAGEDGRTAETFEILHFAAWAPPQR